MALIVKQQSLCSVGAQSDKANMQGIKGSDNLMPSKPLECEPVCACVCLYVDVWLPDLVSERKKSLSFFFAEGDQSLFYLI